MLVISGSEAEAGVAFALTPQTGCRDHGLERSLGSHHDIPWIYLYEGPVRDPWEPVWAPQGLSPKLDKNEMKKPWSISSLIGDQKRGISSGNCSGCSGCSGELGDERVSRG